MRVEKGKKVKVSYVGTFDDGKVFDSTDMHDGEPLEFIAGAGQMISGFDKAVIGMEKGDKKKFRLEAEEAYGMRDPNAIQKIPKSQFPPDQEPKPGMLLQIQQAHGDHNHTIIAEIINVDDEMVTIDLNHPMAGKALNFDIEIIEVSD